MKDLKHISYIGASYSDISVDLNDYDNDEINLVMTNSTDYLYIGLFKPFKNLYFALKTLTTPGNLTFEYYNGTTWTALPVLDLTKNFARNGFVTWDLPSDWATTTINNETLYFIRITATIDVTINGFNMVFANDSDLREHYRQINDYLGSDTDYRAYHQASRKEIIQSIKNSGKTKISSIDGSLTDLTIWDFTRPEQLRLAAAFLCLSKIFAGISDNEEGKFIGLSRSYRKNYKESLNTFLLNIDSNDDGLEDTSEQEEARNATRIVFV